jgi:hypothetical protein
MGLLVPNGREGAANANQNIMVKPWFALAANAQTT